jgi:regulator of RNase E activity RraA
MTWKTDEELFALMRARLFTAVVGDVLDAIGHLHQFLPAGITPLRSDMVVAGRAMPVLEADCFGAGDRPFGLMLKALDDLKPHEVYVASGGSPRYALWGELMSARAVRLKAAGAVLNGYSRDTKGIRELGLPVFSRGRYAQDQSCRGKVIDFRTAIEIEGVRINPGELVFADLDGVLVIPKEAEREAISRSLEKVAGENAVRTAIQNGMSASEAFEKFGVM